MKLPSERPNKLASQLISHDKICTIQQKEPRPGLWPLLNVNNVNLTPRIQSELVEGSAKLVSTINDFYLADR